MNEAFDALPPASIRAGNVLHGKYRLERELGRGAMGTVWSAIHLSLDQRVAIKVISSEYADSTEAIQRFHTEAKAAAKLRSRYVVQVYDDGETPEGLPYIVMEYLEGESLEDRIVREGDVPLAEAVRIATHVGRALARAHGRGIVHRDLKPANIFITKNEDDDMGWVAKVLDFGIAKLDDNRDKSTTKTGTVLGTPLFMSAEQVRGASTVDARADLYSLGMVVYNMITGRYAFEGSSFGDLLVSICTDPLPKLSDQAPWAPLALEQWFQKACARDVDARFQTADEMIDELYAAANLSFDGRMSFSDENSSLNHMVSTAQELHPSGASRTGNEANSSYATAATQHASDGATNTGDASVHTIPGVPEKRRWLVPAILAGALFLTGGATIAWMVASRGSGLAAESTAQALPPPAAAANAELPADTLAEPGAPDTPSAKAEKAKALPVVETDEAAPSPKVEEPEVAITPESSLKRPRTTSQKPVTRKVAAAVTRPPPKATNNSSKTAPSSTVKKSLVKKTTSSEVDIGF